MSENLDAKELFKHLRWPLSWHLFRIVHKVVELQLKKFLHKAMECFDNLLESVHHSMKINENWTQRNSCFPSGSQECRKINDVVVQALVMDHSIRRNNCKKKERHSIERPGIHSNSNSPGSSLISDVNSCQAGTASLPLRLLWIRDYRMIKCLGTKGWLFGVGGESLCSLVSCNSRFRVSG